MRGPYFSLISSPLDATWAFRDWRASSAVSWMAILFCGSRHLLRERLRFGCGSLRLVCLGKFPLENGNGHAEEDGVAKKTKGPDAQADQSLVQRGRVLDDFAQWSGHEPRDDEAHALFNPDANDSEHTREVEPFKAAARRKEQQHHSREVEGYGRPDPRHQG